MLAAYALPGLATAIPTIPGFVYLPAMYGELLGLSAAGLALLGARVFDLIADPLVGVFSDRLVSRWGRRKPWILGGTILASIAVVKLFHPPAEVSALYLAFWSVILYVGWTAIQVPYTAWGAELSPDYYQRARITSAREGVIVVGIVAAGVAPFIGARVGATEREALGAVAWITAVVGPILIANLLWHVPDPRPSTGEYQRPQSPWAAIRAILANRPFVRLLSAWFVNGLATGIPSGLVFYFLEHVLRADQTERSVLVLVYFLSAVAGIPIWLKLSRHLGKHRTWCYGMILACIAFVWVPFLHQGQVIAFGAICVVTGFALGADLALPPALQADVIDYDTLRSGQSRAGLLFALWSMATKLALALAIGTAFPILDAYGFNPTAENAPDALLALAIAYSLVPTALKMIAIALVWNFPITAERQRLIRGRLEILATRNAIPRAA